MSDYVERMLRVFMNKRHVWGKPQTFLTPASKKQAATVAFVIGAEDSNVINVGLTIKAGNGDIISYRTGIRMYLSSDATGDTLEGTAPDSIAIGTNGLFLPNGSDSVVDGVIYTTITGLADLDITEATGADTVYMNVEIDGVVYTSAAITFAA